MNRFRRLIGAILSGAALLTPACAEDNGATEPRTLQPLGGSVRLPKSLVEVSGLAVAGPASVYAHDDEVARVYEIDLATGAASHSFALGRPQPTGDFEAIILDEASLFLVTSKGEILKAALTPQRTELAYTRIAPRTDESCNIEAAAREESGAFLFACKNASGRLVIHRAAGEGPAPIAIDLDLAGVAPEPKKFRATDMLIDRKTNTILVLDGGGAGLLEITRTGEPLGYWRLGGRHRQAEGLALMPDGGLVVSDEGNAKHAVAAKLTRYPPR